MSPAAAEAPKAAPRRRWWLRIGSLLLALLSLCMAFVAWLSLTESGLRWAWSQVEQRQVVPGLQLDGLSGRLIGPIALQEVRWRDPAGELHATQIEIDWSPTALWADTLQLNSVSAGSLSWQPTASEQAAPTPAEPTHWKQQLAWRWPLFELPLNIDIRRVGIAELSLLPATEGGLTEAAAESRSTQPPEPIRLSELQLSASISRQGEIALRHFALSSPWGEITEADGVGSSDAPWTLKLRTPGDTPDDWLLSASADADALRLNARNGAEQAGFQLIWSGSELQLNVQVQDFDSRKYGLDWSELLSADLRLTSDFQTLQVEGNWQGHPLSMDNLSLQLGWSDDFSQIELSEARWHFAGGGEGRAHGTIVLAEPRLDIQWGLNEFPLQPWLPKDSGAAEQSAAVPQLVRAEGVIVGPIDDLELRGKADLTALQKDLSIAWLFRKTDSALVVEQLELQSVNGQAQINGQIGLSEPLSVELRFDGSGLDPYWVMPNWQGGLDFSGQANLKQGSEGWTGQLDVERLGGEINAQPLQGDLHLQLSGGEIAALSATLRAGEGSLQLVPLNGRAAKLQLAQWRLDPWWPGLRGRLDGEVQVGNLPALLSTPPARWQNLSFDLDAEQLRWDELRIGNARLKGQWPVPGSADGAVELEWRGLFREDLGEWQGKLTLAGRPENYRLQLQTARDDLQVSLAASGQHGKPGGRVELQTLSFSSAKAGEWGLKAPFALEYGNALRFAPACLHGDLGDLCLSMDTEGSARVWQLRADAMQLDRLFKLLVLDEGLQVSGQVDLDVRVREVEGTWTPGPLSLRGSAGEIRSLDQDVQLLGWDSLSLEGEMADPSTWQASGQLSSETAGNVDFDLRLPITDQPQWQAARGSVQVELRQIAALQLMLPDVVGAVGEANGSLNWDLDRSPALSGELRLTGLGGKVPGLGVEFADSDLTLYGAGERFNIDGQLRSGGGPLRIEGEWQSGGSARVRLAGKQVRMADTRRLKIVASPDVLINWQDGGAKLSGEVEISEALVDLERLESGVTTSADVVVLDPRFEAEGVQALPIQVDLQLLLGDAVRLQGFGFDGGISGKLRITERPGEAARGRGSLNLSGKYTAYAQDLEIERGRLQFANGPLDNPGIDLRAMRKVRRDKVGIEVRGPALAPRLSLWSEPPMNQAEALSLLVLGQPLSSANSADGAQLGQAAAAMGGNLLAAKVGGRLGLDTFGVSDSSSIGAAFTVGKYLSPRLYLAYGVALFEDASAVTVRYLINERLDVEIESSRESRAGINYRLERD